ncbi:MAG TPA: SufS family cysteine desulfurase, partial [Candidatus Limnocylindria bacterium]|nr:SufS family cysteine desulfurase [Candidatus Limnocylindria bacterium]
MALQQALPTTTSEGFDGAALRADFPVFDTPARNGERLVYLDSAASAPKPRSVIDAVADAYAHHYANVHRGIYELSEDATARYEGARKRLAAFIGAPSDREVIFVRNATEAINLVAYAWGRANVRAGDLILSTEMEHHANLVPWQQLAIETGATLEYVRITDDGRLDADDLARRLAKGPKLVAIAHVSNALGTINPVAEITRQAHDAGALVLLDAAQSVPHMPVSVADLGVDFAALSGHKMLGPSGIGALWARRELLNAMPPFMTGGSMIRRVTLEGTEWNEVPWKFEAGTPAIAEAQGLTAAIDYLEALGMDNVRAHERELFANAWDALSAVDGLRLLGPSDPDAHAGVISFVLDDIHPHDVATVFDQEGIAVRAGHHCAQPVMLHYD